MNILNKIKDKFSGGSEGWKQALIGGAIMSFILGVAIGVIALIDWGAKHQVIVKFPIVVTTRRIITIIEREPQQVLSPVAQEVIEEVPEDLSDIELMIRSMWGAEEFRVARALARCESCGENTTTGRCGEGGGFDPLAVNWETKDIGLFQINLPIWEEPVLEEFGYTRADLFEVHKNIAVAYWIWDRADGEVGNNRGSWGAWVALGNECFLGEL